MTKKIVHEKREKCVRHVKMKLTQEEFDDRATQLAQALAEKQAAESELASVKSSFKATIDGCQSRIEKYQQQVQERAEWRDCEHEKVYVYDTKTVYFLNLETGKIGETRGMRPDEMQQELKYEEGAE